jgi:hypothetical protein
MFVVYHALKFDGKDLPDTLKFYYKQLFTEQETIWYYSFADATRILGAIDADRYLR